MIVIDCSLRGICAPVTLFFDYSFYCCFLFSFQLIKNSRFRFNFPLNAASRKGVGEGRGYRVPLERGSLAQLRYINCFICVESAFLFNKLLIVSQTQSATRGREREGDAKWLATLCLPHCACPTVPATCSHLNSFRCAMRFACGKWWRFIVFIKVTTFTPPFDVATLPPAQTPPLPCLCPPPAPLLLLLFSVFYCLFILFIWHLFRFGSLRFATFPIDRWLSLASLDRCNHPSIDWRPQYQPPPLPTVPPSIHSVHICMSSA